MASKKEETKQFDLSKKMVVSMATLPDEGTKNMHQRVD